MTKVQKTIKFKCEHCEGTGKHIKLNPVWLRLVRLHVGYSLREVARNVGCSASFLSDIEHRTR